MALAAIDRNRIEVLSGARGSSRLAQELSCTASWIIGHLLLVPRKSELLALVEEAEKQKAGGKLSKMRRESGVGILRI